MDDADDAMLAFAASESRIEEGESESLLHSFFEDASAAATVVDAGGDGASRAARFAASVT
jgi:hypothetical protein